MARSLTTGFRGQGRAYDATGCGCGSRLPKRQIFKPNLGGVEEIALRPLNPNLVGTPPAHRYVQARGGDNLKERTMLTKSKLFAVTAIVALVSTSSAFAFDKADVIKVQDTATHSQRHSVKHPADAQARQDVQPLTAVERLEPFTAEEKAILDAPDPFHHPDEF